jgi:hypothetical protein
MGIQVESELGKGSTFSFILENKMIIQKEINSLDEDNNPISMRLSDFTVKMNYKYREKIQCCPRVLVVDDEGFNI